MWWATLIPRRSERPLRKLPVFRLSNIEINTINKRWSCNTETTTWVLKFYGFLFTGFHSFVDPVNDLHIFQALFSIYGYFRLFALQDNSCHLIHLHRLMRHVGMVQWPFIGSAFDRPIARSGLKFPKSIRPVNEKPVEVIH